LISKDARLIFSSLLSSSSVACCCVCHTARVVPAEGGGGDEGFVRMQQALAVCRLLVLVCCETYRQ
jgi:hypothetical protein